MGKKKQRIDTGTERRPLTDNPFAALGGLDPSQLPQGEEPPADAPVAAGPAFSVERTRKGGYPISLEKRPNGKVVTVVSRASGDAEALLKALKKQCGAGGTVEEGRVEVQGDHRERIEAFLRKHLA